MHCTLLGTLGAKNDFGEDGRVVNKSKSTSQTYGIQTLEYNNLGKKRRREVEPHESGKT